MEELKIEAMAGVKKDVVTIDKEIKDCNPDNLFDFICSHFAIFFLDLQEMNRFINYLINNKSNITIESLLNNFKDILKEFRKENEN